MPDDDAEAREMDELFRSEAHTLLATLTRELLKVAVPGPDAAPAQAECYRVLHTLKGMANMAGYPDVQRLAHDAETSLAPGATPDVRALLATVDALREKVEGTAAAERDPFVQVDPRRLDSLLDLAGELNLAETRLRYEARAGAVSEPSLHAISDLIRQLQDEVMQARLLDIQHVFQHLPRLVHDAGAERGREVRLQLDASALQLDRALVDRLQGILAHVVQNAVVHGVEPPEERAAAHKPRVATIRVSARRENELTLIEVDDDGRGVDVAGVRRKAEELGLLKPQDADPLPMERAIELLFAAGLTTAAKTTRLAGRGVGLTAAREALQSIGGRILVTSTAGAGTRVVLRLPPSVAVLDTLVAQAEEGLLAFPSRNVLRIYQETDATQVGGGAALLHEGRLIPIIDRLGRRAGAPRAAGGKVVVLRTAGATFGMRVERVLGTHPAVIKALDPVVQLQERALGATVLGDGSIAVVIDPEEHLRTVSP